MVSGGLPDPAKKPLSDDMLFLLTTASTQLHLAQDLIDRSGHDIVGAQLQVVIDAIAAAIRKQPHDNH